MQEAGKALTVEQLCQMDGKPVLLKSPWWTEWCILAERGEHEIAGDAISFTRRHYGVVCLGLSDYGKTWTAYAYPHVRIDREAWTAEWVKHDGYTECSKCEHWYDSLESEDDGDRPRFCPGCGRAMTAEAWAELAKRIGVTV